MATKEEVISALERTDGNITAAAKELGVTRSNINARLAYDEELRQALDDINAPTLARRVASAKAGEVGDIITSNLRGMTADELATVAAVAGAMATLASVR